MDNYSCPRLYVMLLFKSMTTKDHVIYRPKRERKIPSHMKGGDFEYNIGGIAKTKAVPETKLSEVKDEIEKETMEAETTAKEEDDSDGDDKESDGDWNSEDDPERLWCVCQQPHNNRFMICCDSCLDWYHGRCVSITKKMAKEMEEAGNEWTCPKCKKGSDVIKEPEKEPEKKPRGKAVGKTKRPSSAMSNDSKEAKVIVFIK